MLVSFTRVGPIATVCLPGACNRPVIPANLSVLETALADPQLRSAPIIVGTKGMIDYPVEGYKAHSTVETEIIVQNFVLKHSPHGPFSPLVVAYTVRRNPLCTATVSSKTGCSLG